MRGALAAQCAPHWKPLCLLAQALSELRGRLRVCAQQALLQQQLAHTLAAQDWLGLICRPRLLQAGRRPEPHLCGPGVSPGAAALCGRLT